MAGVWVFLGGGCGALGRWAISLGLPSPWGTFVANVLGSFLLAVLMASPLGSSESWRLALGVGALGGFTTYSTFNLEMLQALQRGSAWGALGYAPLTLATCLIASAAGWWLGSQWAAGSGP